MKLKKELRLLEGKFKPLKTMVPEKKKKKITEQLRCTKVDSGKYLEISLGTTLVLTLLTLGLTVTQGLITSLGCSLMTFSLLYLLSIKLPGFIRDRHERKIEKSLSRALRTISTELKIGMPFHICFSHASDQDLTVSKELKRVQRGVERGSSYPEALTKISERYNSEFVRRTVNQLISAHSGDSEEGGEALKKLSQEQESLMRTKMEEYNQKLVVYSLIFIATSAVLPAMFQALVIIGSNFLKLNIGPLQSFLIPCVGFPILNLGIFAYIAIKRPW